MTKEKEELDQLKKVTGGLCEYKDLEKDTCFEQNEYCRYVLVYDYSNIKWDTNFLVDHYVSYNGTWRCEGQNTITQSRLFSFKCIGKWRP